MLGWVSQRQYDEACQQIRTLERNVIDARAIAEATLKQLERATAMLDRLIDRIGTGGVMAPPPRAALAPLARVERSDLDIAIELQSANDPGLARHLHRYAQEARLIGTDETELINQILHWPSSDDDNFAGYHPLTE